MEALPSDRAEYQGKLLNATARQKNVENDAQLLQNRIALLKKEEARAWGKIQQTKGRAEEIGAPPPPTPPPSTSALATATTTPPTTTSPGRHQPSTPSHSRGSEDAQGKRAQEPRESRYGEEGGGEGAKVGGGEPEDGRAGTASEGNAARRDVSFELPSDRALRNQMQDESGERLICSTHSVLLV